MYVGLLLAYLGGMLFLFTAWAVVMLRRKNTCPPCSERLIWSIRDIQDVILAGLRKAMKVR